MKKLHWTDSEFDRTYFLLLFETFRIAGNTRWHYFAVGHRASLVCL